MYLTYQCLYPLFSRNITADGVHDMLGLPHVREVLIAVTGADNDEDHMEEKPLSCHEEGKAFYDCMGEPFSVCVLNIFKDREHLDEGNTWPALCADLKAGTFCEQLELCLKAWKDANPVADCTVQGKEYAECGAKVYHDCSDLCKSDISVSIA